MRRVFLDTETTGLDPNQGHRIVEIAAIAYDNNTPISPENGGQLHFFINPEREIDAEAEKIHGLNNEFLSEQPVFGYVAEQLLDFIRGATLYIHNAQFDVDFMNAELRRLNMPDVADIAAVQCTLEWARKNVKKAPSYSLDNLCRHFGIDLAMRSERHSAIVDTRLLAQLFFEMTREQASMNLKITRSAAAQREAKPVILRRATAEEEQAHQQYLQAMEEETKIRPIFLRGAD